MLNPGEQGTTDPPDVHRVKQRLRELYDFKTETEWPKRVRNPSHASLWISKSSSEEDKSQSSQPSQPSQSSPQATSSTAKTSATSSTTTTTTITTTTTATITRVQQSPLERSSSEPGKHHHRHTPRRLPEVPPIRRDSSGGNENLEERNKLPTHTRVRERFRTRSDDYEKYSRKYSEPELERRSNFEYRRRLPGESSFLPGGGHHRRTQSQYEARPRFIQNPLDYSQRPRAMSQHESRPRTPIPPREIEDLYRDFRAYVKPAPIEAPGAVHGFPPRQRRNSTRYKVYLT